MANEDSTLNRLRRESKTVYTGPTDVMQPDFFEDTSRLHDWRNHVPDSIRELWPDLSETERRLVMLTAAPMTYREEHD